MSAPSVFPQFSTMPLGVLRQPFDHPEWIFELKYDGFRSLAFVGESPKLRMCRLVSRNGNTFRRFDDLGRAVASAVPARAVLDGEIVCLGEGGEPQFYDLMRHRSPQYFYAFDLLWLEGRDLRGLPLRVRKEELKRLLGDSPSPYLRYVDHVERDGILLYNLVCGRDLEGIVGKKADGLYTPEETSWVKIKNPKYSQNEGRRELFDGRRV